MHMIILFKSRPLFLWMFVSDYLQGRLIRFILFFLMIVYRYPTKALLFFFFLAIC